MDQKLKQLNHDIRNLIPIKSSDMKLLTSNISDIDKTQLLILIKSFNDVLKFYSEHLCED